MYVKKTSLILNVVFLFLASVAVAQGPPTTPPGQAKKFPSLDEQLKKAHAVPGSELEKLIKQNQNFDKLKDKDADDPIVPPWLKVYWRKGHPEANYDNDNDKSGGYPLVLKEILEWMVSHQDFKPGNPEATMAPGYQFGDLDADEADAPTILMSRFGPIVALGASAGTNVRTSCAQTVSRNESDN